MKSPIIKKPLHYPGESLDRKISDIVDSSLMYIVATGVFVMLAFIEWWRFYKTIPPAPLLYSLLALIMIGITTWKILNTLSRVKKLKLGRDGEKAVGQFLDCLREQGARIFHDIPGDRFNLDHVVVHTSGVYVIETKTLSKPDKGEAKLIFSGDRILKNGYELDRNPIIQVKAGSKWLAELIEQSTGHKFKIQPVVVFPGWYIEQPADWRKCDIWVLNPKALPAFIENNQIIMKPEELTMISHHLDMHIRASQMKN